MKRLLRWALGPTVLLTTVSCASQGATAGTAGTPQNTTPAAAAPAAPSAPASGPRSVYTGVYTAAQADRGDATQASECSACHNPADWAAGRILGGWNNRPIVELIRHIQSTMPLDSPGRLTYQQYTDIMAFMLELNNIPAGQTELPADADAQQQILVEYRR